MKIQPLTILICLISAIFAAYPINYKSEARILEVRHCDLNLTGNFVGSHHRSTLLEIANSLEIQKETQSLEVNLKNIEGTTIHILSVEDRNPEIAEKNLQKVFALYQREMKKQVVLADSLPTKPVFPWWRSALALGMLLLFTLTAKPSRR